ncbi:N-acyl-D-amino-acid deacylase family protein [Caulobacter mirabilis]|uniref:Amidohydrolase n=1 Tax=Caulobacter mirabilis TaxID=69666 RepID=A0A2D2B1V1_9CAUL|nr:amidohydrolase family protein [Caulobacter mirabilis]ATQ44196.1 amidohydrolase [Caulobacter mirabilis]
MVRRRSRGTHEVRLLGIGAVVSLALVAGGARGQVEAAPLRLDLLLRGGLVLDGTGAPPRRADVGIAGDRIVFVGDAKDLTAGRVVDATGLYVAPGFIDPHTHATADLQSDDAALRAGLNHLAQGVTTVFIGNDGDGSPDIRDRLDRAQQQGVGVNVASFVGFGAVRRQVVGEAAREPTADELQRMKDAVAKAMCEGAIGFSTGLYYAPQSFSKTEEVIALAREAAVRGGVYDSHLRDEGSDNIGLKAAVEEALRIGREADMPVHIAHIKALGVDVHGKAPEIIALVEAERAKGREVTADQYPWAASGTRVSNALLPRWAMDGGKAALRARLADPALRDRLVADTADNLRRRGGPMSILLTSGPHAGKRLGDVAKAWGVDPVEAAFRVVRDEGDAAVASFNMAEADIAAFAVRPWVMTGSDGSEGHPRKFGTFPLAWTKFVIAEKLMTPEQFVRRGAGLTADAFRLTDRGYLKPGQYADVVAFDPKVFAAQATYEQPKRLSTGARWVLVNGQVAIADGQPTDAFAGRALRRPAQPDWKCPK